MTKEYVIYCDESAGKGRYYSNFYGGVIVSAKDLQVINDALSSTAEAVGLNAEVKWQKVSAGYLEKYETLINHFFDFVDQDMIKVRIMFTKNTNVMDSRRLSPEQRDNGFFLLYYQFLKHSFGLRHIPRSTFDEKIRVRLNLDQLPDTKEKNKQFKSYIASLGKSPELRRNGVFFPEDQIAEIDSKKHIILQCLDVVLGSMHFRLNDLHLEKPEGERRRGKRTVAKEKLYKTINRRISKNYPRFNIGITTSDKGNQENRWLHHHRHWVFVPKNSVLDMDKSKRRS